MNVLTKIRDQNYNLNYNAKFLEILHKSFEIYLKTSARSNEKLKILHGFIATALQNLIGLEYEINSLGFNNNKEISVPGRYMGKKVDITIAKRGRIIAGLAVKFVMSNYSQNSNNYFECMLGETANIRSNNIPYFQIFIIPEKVPYYDKQGVILKFEEITQHNLDKYMNLSNDNTDVYMHTPTKTFVGLVHVDECPWNIQNFALYKNFYLTHKYSFSYSTRKIIFGNTVVYNDFDAFIKKVAHFILSI